MRTWRNPLFLAAHLRMKARLLFSRFHALPNVASRVLPLPMSLSQVIHDTLLHLAWVTSICSLFSEQAFLTVPSLTLSLWELLPGSTCRHF